ncbi:hypothetical protein AVEN_459-1 [Araneus ventricosus]|uniref:Uncharacterized protein n=1 Tax=Araneus ventricosus TaxID=182803 RepID=A0A4Y2X625_ARAVE|nr:hypothetical protein AVEN_459-1 [Araneus ventricosus]
MPLTKEFQNYHRTKYEKKRKKINFKTKLEVITEAEETGNVQKLHKLPSPGEMETEAEIADNTFDAENYGEMEDEAEIVINTAPAECYSEIQTETQIVDNAVSAENYGEMETEAAILDRTFATENSGEMSSKQDEQSVTMASI